MMRPINIIDSDYIQWIKELSSRYRRSQIKAAVKVNQEMLQFYWELGRDIVERDAENHYGSKFYTSLSRDLRAEIQNASGLSERNLRYTKKFYLFYEDIMETLQQVVADSEENILQQVAAKLFSLPWGHHLLLMDKFANQPEKAWFYICQSVNEGWSRNILLNYLDTDLYERQGKALTNFGQTLPDETSDLAQEITKDPYDFAFTGITGHYNEQLLKDKLLGNITQFLIELGTGFAYVGKEYRIQVGEREQFIDLLFYHLKLSCYVIIEVKIGKFDFADIGQLGGYVVSCNHILRKEGRDNPTIGLLICKEKDRIQAQYALESSSQPIAISEYDLEKFFPEKLEGVIPTIEEIETKLNEDSNNYAGSDCTNIKDKQL